MLDSTALHGELGRLETETFEIDDLIEVGENMAAWSSCSCSCSSTCSSSTSTSSTCGCSTSTSSGSSSSSSSS